MHIAGLTTTTSRLLRSSKKRAMSPGRVPSPIPLSDLLAAGWVITSPLRNLGGAGVRTWCFLCVSSGQSAARENPKAVGLWRGSKSPLAETGVEDTSGPLNVERMEMKSGPLGPRPMGTARTSTSLDPLVSCAGQKWEGGVVPLPPGRVATSIIHADDYWRICWSPWRVIAAPTRKQIYEPDDGREGGWSHKELARAIGRAVGRAAVFAPHLPRGVLDAAAATDRFLRGDRAKLTPDRGGLYVPIPTGCRGSTARCRPPSWQPRIAGRDRAEGDGAVVPARGLAVARAAATETVPHPACECRIRSCPSPSSGPNAGLRPARPAWCRASSPIGGIALRDQRMTRQIMGFEPGIDIARRPVDQRVDLEPPLRVAGVHLEPRQIGAGRGLERLASGEAGIIVRQCLFQRLDLAQIAAAIRIKGPPEAVFVPHRQIIGIGGQDHQIEAQPTRQRVAIGERFGKMLAGVEEKHRNRRNRRRRIRCSSTALSAPKLETTARSPARSPLITASSISCVEEPREHPIEPQGIMFGKARGQGKRVAGAVTCRVGGFRLHGACPLLSGGGPN